MRALYFKDYHTGLSPPEGPYGAQALQGGAYEIPAPLAMCHRHPRRGRAANNCTNCFCGFKRKCETFSITFTFASQNSSDLSSGRRPTSKTAEFCDANVKVIEIVSHLRLKPQKQVVQLLAARPGHHTVGETVRIRLAMIYAMQRAPQRTIRSQCKGACTHRGIGKRERKHGSSAASASHMLSPQRLLGLYGAPHLG